METQGFILEELLEWVSRQEYSSAKDRHEQQQRDDEEDRLADGDKS